MNQDDRKRYIIEYRIKGEERVTFFYTPNKAHAETRAKTASRDDKYSKIILHETTLDKSFDVVSTVELEERAE